MTTYIDFHALHTLAPNNINRGEDGAPKTAFFGGVQRQRISSQALKAAQRRAFREHLDAADLGVRTKRVVELVARRMQELDSSLTEESSLARAEAAFAKAGIKVSAPKAKKGAEPKAPAAGYLMFLGNHQVERLAQALVDAGEEGLASKAEAKTLLDTEHSIDVALFGRMVADDASLNVDAAVQMAHALGVHAAMPDFDYYTAVDDLEKADEATGAGMIGTVEMMSSTMYRFATVNVDQLLTNLGSVEAASRAAEAFATTFIEALPSGKQNTFAALTLPDVVSVVVRDRRPVSYATAFETPVEAGDGQSRRAIAAQRLATEARDIEEIYGFHPLVSKVMAVSSLTEVVQGLGEAANRAELIAAAREAVESAAAAEQS